MPAIGFKSFSLNDVPYLISGAPEPVAGPTVVIASGQTSALTPDHRIPPGTVVVKKTATGKYYLADDADNGDRNAAASVQSAEAGDAGWVSETLTFEVTVGGVSYKISVTLGTADDTTAEIVSALNSNEGFSAHLVASGTNGNPLTVATRAKGDVYLKATSTLDGAAAGFGAAGAEDYGAVADYLVTSEFAELKDLNGAAQDYMVTTLRSGHFDESELSNLTGEARAVLAARGSHFG